ncbi:glycosyl hydrolase [Phytohabitans sp. ZYX-F-186]|uniref:glucan endo-1,3-beta-D-glucosidase n=1 Tax=Phytohabitans maris TaxID=3071409 RepID=A0ABU0ZAB0_9ACTN|nr:glycosyl hydrolase [Phytohabitans sp. ZYX-F-186]MDQ7903994.1 glycosyl hydrolase [Phytohabitans sp. ZYX-F-186]
MRAADGGLLVSSAPPTASANAVVTPFVPAVTAGGPLRGVEVVGYGAFHVVLRATLRDGGSVEATVVQGSPLLYLRFEGTDPVLTAAGESSVDGAAARLTVAGQRWDLLASGGGWRQDGTRFTATGAARGRVAVARVPDGADQGAWDAAAADAAARPVLATRAATGYDPAAGTVTQTLTADRGDGRPGLWALLPHQQRFAAGTPRELAGAYRDALGTLSIVEAGEIRVRVPMPGLLTAAPQVAGADRTRVVADLDRDLADEPGAGGSYFGLKELGRLATIAQVAQGVGAQDRRRAALDRLRPQLVDWLTHGGGDDARYFAYDRTWGGLVAVPAEFGSQDYNDHHLQYGYLVRAAAVLAAADQEFLRDYGGAVDLVAREYSGGGEGFPPFRVFNPYLGHSAASGFAPFADGNNQESSSEAAAAWEAVAAWGQVRGRADLVAYGVTHYALETATARMYWLGEGLARPAGYAHRVAGIVWDAKIDYATFFDPKPESVEGIQLLPLTFGSLYRADPAAAESRVAALDKVTGGQPRVWGDLFAADLAAADPDAALRRLDGGPPREESTSRAMVRYYASSLAAFGPPREEVTADAPYGMAFGDARRPTLAVVNPTGEPRTVTFRRAGEVVARVDVAPGQAVTRTP